MALVSKGRMWDMKMRAGLLDLIEVLVKSGKHELAREVGETSKLFAHRIATHDYKKEDEQWAIVDELDRQWKELSQGTV